MWLKTWTPKCGGKPGCNSKDLGKEYGIKCEVIDNMGEHLNSVDNIWQTKMEKTKEEAWKNCGNNIGTIWQSIRDKTKEHMGRHMGTTGKHEDMWQSIWYKIKEQMWGTCRDRRRNNWQSIQNKCNELINNKLGTALVTLLRTYEEQDTKSLQCPFPPPHH